MPPKEESARIGQKQYANTVKKEQKVFLNGHKCFLVDEAKAISETLAQENRTRNKFDAMRQNLVMPRNPLTGDATPRQDIPGVWNSNTHILHLKDEYDVNREHPTLAVKPVGSPNKEIAAKVGSLERKYENGDSTVGLPLSYKMAKVGSLKTLQDNLSVKVDMMNAVVSQREKDIRHNLIKNRMSVTKYELRPGQV